MIDSGKPEPEVIATEEIYHGEIFDVAKYTIREGDHTYKRDVVHHSGGASIVAVFDDMTIALVRQYRQPVLRYVIEIPAGKIDARERPEVCAARELEEEVGYHPSKIEKLTEFFSSPGFCEEKIWIYLGLEL